MKTSLHLIVLGSLLASAAESQIATYTFEGEVQTPATFNSLVSASNFTLSPSTTLTFPAGNAPSSVDAISGTGWNGADGSKWWEFTVTANPGFGLNLSSLKFDDRATSTGPVNWSVDINGTSAALGMPTHGSFASSPMNSVDVSGPDFQGLGSATVRLFGFGASGSGGTWRIDNVSLDGGVSVVPEPRAYPLLAGLALLTLGLYRRYAHCRA